jgi:hypothetical protein
MPGQIRLIQWRTVHAADPKPGVKTGPKTRDFAKMQKFFGAL